MTLKRIKMSTLLCLLQLLSLSGKPYVKKKEALQKNKTFKPVFIFFAQKSRCVQFPVKNPSFKSLFKDSLLQDQGTQRSKANSSSIFTQCLFKPLFLYFCHRQNCKKKTLKYIDILQDQLLKSHF